MASAKDKVKPKLAVNFTTPFSWKGKHYNGISLNNGVGYELVPAPCTKGAQLFKFTGCAEGAAPTGIFFHDLTASDDTSVAVKEYLQLKPAK